MYQPPPWTCYIQLEYHHLCEVFSDYPCLSLLPSNSHCTHNFIFFCHCLVLVFYIRIDCHLSREPYSEIFKFPQVYKYNMFEQDLFFLPKRIFVKIMSFSVSTFICWTLVISSSSTSLPFVLWTFSNVFVFLHDILCIYKGRKNIIEPGEVLKIPVVRLIP